MGHILKCTTERVSYIYRFSSSILCDCICEGRFHILKLVVIEEDLALGNSEEKVHLVVVLNKLYRKAAF